MENTILQEIDVQEVLHEEIATIEKFYWSKNKLFEETIPIAAKKLEPYYKDKTKICSILTSVFKKDFERDVRRTCPPQYKHVYLLEEEELPKTLLEETLTYMEEVLTDATVIVKSIKDKLQKVESKDKAELEHYIIQKFGGIAELKKMVEDWKEASVEVARIKQIHDDRAKLDPFTKFLLRIQSFYLSKNKVAELADISSKWMKTGIENDKDLEDLAQKLWATDAKLEIIRRWFNTNKIRDDKGLPIIALPDFRKKLQ